MRLFFLWQPFPLADERHGVPSYREKSGGGSCAIQYHATPEGLQYQISSPRARLTDNRWRNIDEGVEPTHVIDTTLGYSDFYDFAAISEIIKESTIPTDIQTISTTTDGKWYTLDGYCLNGKPTGKGLYIHHGKKTAIGNRHF